MCDRVIPRQSITRHNQSGVYFHNANTFVIFRITFSHLKDNKGTVINQKL